MERRILRDPDLACDELGAPVVSMGVEGPAQAARPELFCRVANRFKLHAFDGAPDVPGPNRFTPEAVDQDQIAVKGHLPGLDARELQLGGQLVEKSRKREVTL